MKRKFRTHVVDNLNKKTKHADNLKTDKIDIFFNDIHDKVLELIKESVYCVGCIAWLREDKILQELKQKKGCGIVINNERLQKELQQKYAELKTFHKKEDAVKTIGKKKKNWSAMMHNKFLVGMNKNKTPTFVLTGSFNFWQFVQQFRKYARDSQTRHCQKYLENYKQIAHLLKKFNKKHVAFFLVCRWSVVIIPSIKTTYNKYYKKCKIILDFTCV